MVTVWVQSSLSQASCIKPFGLLAETPEQLADVDPIVVEGGLARAAALPHPLAEGNHQCRIGYAACDRTEPNDASLFQVLEEEARAMDQTSL